MRLGINLGYWGAGNDAENLELAREADRLGYAVAWAAEAYGSDAATVLAWIAAQTERIDIGAAVFQIPGRTPANTAMTAATLDTLSGGRFRLGLDDLIEDADGKSQISREDFAVAILDELDRPRHVRKRFTAAY